MSRAIAAQAMPMSHQVVHGAVSGIAVGDEGSIGTGGGEAEGACDHQRHGDCPRRADEQQVDEQLAGHEQGAETHAGVIRDGAADRSEERAPGSGVRAASRTRR